jgi:hypothetical protein
MAGAACNTISGGAHAPDCNTVRKWRDLKLLPATAGVFKTPAAARPAWLPACKPQQRYCIGAAPIQQLKQLKQNQQLHQQLLSQQLNCADCCWLC